MGYKTFQIFVDSPTGSYYAGTNVTGRVVVALDKPKKVRGLRIKFSGVAKVSWTETESVRKDDGNTANENVTYSAEEEYFSNKYFLVGSESSEVMIPEGENVYQFSTTLPPRLPTSMDGEHGSIRYTITATLDRPWKMDEEVKLNIGVVTPVDLNYLPQVKEVMKKEASKTFCCLCCQSGPLTLAGSIPYSGFVPGQAVAATIEVDNASNVQISSVKGKLIKELKWIVRSPQHKEKVDKIELVKVSLEGVPGGASKSWLENFQIPTMPFINLDACSIIKVEFYLEVVADPSGAHTSLEIKFPLTIGTTPLYLGQSGATAPSAPVDGDQGVTKPPLYPIFDATDLSSSPPPPLGFVVTPNS